EAMQARRDGSTDLAGQLLEKALSLDPDLAAAALRLAIWRFETRPVEAREAFQTALRRRASLDLRDTALLAAAEHSLRQPSDLAEWEKRLAAAAEHYPDDAEIWIYLCDARSRRLGFDDAIAACDKALALEPGHVVGWTLKAFALGYRGDS